MEQSVPFIFGKVNIMMFLRITAADGTRKYIPDNYVLQVSTTTDTLDAGSDYRAPNVLRGRISEVKYYDGANATAGAIVLTAVSAYTGASSILYEYGCITVDGSFSVMLRN